MNIRDNMPKKSFSEFVIKKDFLIEKTWTVWVLMFIFWTVICITHDTQTVLLSHAYPDKYTHYNWIKEISTTFFTFYMWFVFTPVIFWFGKKISFDNKEKLVRNLAIHLILSFVTVVTYLFITSPKLLMYPEKYPNIGIFEHFLDRLYLYTHFELIVYWAILGVGASLDYYKKFRERESEASRLLLRSTKLEAQLAKAQLDSLKMQLHPHFLFNTLHAISALMKKNPTRSRRMIARLSELLRSTLEITDRQTISLKEEINLTKLYLEIEQERFGDKLQVNINIAPEEFDVAVPSFILQPLIENTIKHGIKNLKETAVIEIKTEKENNKLKIFVIDNGKGFPTDKTLQSKDGIGLSNTKNRLKQIYDERQEFKTYNSEKGGATVEISIPYNKIDKSENK